MFLSHDTLNNFLEMNFALVQQHTWSLADIENLLPWERGVYVGLLAAHVKAESERIRDEQAVIRARMNRK